jgi:hypothetical protein
MTSRAGDDRPLPAARAFVVQLRGEAEVARGHWVGRIAHVVSGRTAHFETLPELVAFIERVLAGRGVERPPGPPEEA